MKIKITGKTKRQLILGKLSEEFYPSFEESLKDGKKLQRIAAEIVSFVNKA